MMENEKECEEHKMVEKTMDKIEADYKEFLDKPEDFLAENWQDVLAVYVMKYGQDASIKMDKSCRDDLEQIFFLICGFGLPAQYGDTFMGELKSPRISPILLA